MSRMKAGIVMTILVVLSFGPLASAHQKGWPGKRLSQAFPEAAKFTSRQVSLAGDQLGRIEQAIGERVEAESRVPTFYPAFNKAGESIGVVLFADQAGENGSIEMGVAVDPQGKVQRVVIFSSREDKGIQKEAFLNQFVGKGVGDPLKVGEEVTSAPGAQKASQAVEIGRASCRERV